MRKNVLVGAVIALATVGVVLVSAAFGLKLESVALLGASAGAVLALVPDRSPSMRLAGFAGGVVAAWTGFLVRAAVLPDSTGGRAVAVGLVVAVCVVAVVAGAGRVSLWSTLLGAAAMVGAYEFTYAAAPPEVASTSVSAVTALLVTVAAGFVATALVVPAGGSVAERAHRGPATREGDATDLHAHTMLETTR